VDRLANIVGKLQTDMHGGRPEVRVGGMKCKNLKKLPLRLHTYTCDRFSIHLQT
jgi:hypothetical protein